MRRAFITGVAALLLGACDAEQISAPAITSLEIDAVADVLFPGDTTRLTPVVQNANGEYLLEPDVAWASSDTTIVRVTAEGRAIAVRPGSAEVIMTAGGDQARHMIRVDAGFVRIEAGPQATCGQMHNGDLYCWGYSRTFADIYEQGGLPSSFALPRRIPTDLRFKQFSVGSRHTCAITHDGKAYCWGSGEKGAIGDGVGGHFNTSVPRAVAGDVRFSEVSAAWEHSCGLSIDGVAYCWGRGYEGQLGNGEFGGRASPTPVKTDLRFKQLQAAGSNTCGLTLSGETYCWGHRDYLGDSTITEHQSLPRRIAIPVIDVFDSANDDPCGITPDKQMYCWTNKIDRVAHVGSVGAVTVGGNFVCVTRLDGTVACYGGNEYGQLGNGSRTASETLVAPGSPLKFAQISAGGRHTCGITDTGAAYCWGYNAYGQIGDGTRVSPDKPSRIVISRE